MTQPTGPNQWEPPHHPGYGPPHPTQPLGGGWGPPPPPPQRRKRWPWVVAGILALFVIIGVIGNATKKDPASESSAHASVSGQPSASATAATSNPSVVPTSAATPTATATSPAAPTSWSMPNLV